MNVKTNISYSRFWDKVNSQISHVSVNHMKSTYRNGVNIIAFSRWNSPKWPKPLTGYCQNRPIYLYQPKFTKMSSSLQPDIPTICWTFHALQLKSRSSEIAQYTHTLTGTATELEKSVRACDLKVSSIYCTGCFLKCMIL